MTTAAKRAKKKANHKTGEKALAAKALRAEKHAAILARQEAERQEVDDFFGGPLPKPDPDFIEVVDTSPPEGVNSYEYLESEE